MNSMECPGSFTSLTPRQSSLTTSTMMEVDQVSMGGGGGGGHLVKLTTLYEHCMIKVEREEREGGDKLERAKERNMY